MYIGYHASREFIVSSSSDIATANLFNNQYFKYLDWLVFLHPKEINIAYDVDVFVASLCYLIGLTKEECQILHDKEKLEITPYRLTYFAGKFFAIDIGHGEGHPCFELINAAQTGYLQTHYKEVETLEDIQEKAKEAHSLIVGLSRAYKRLGLTLERFGGEDIFGSPIKAFLKAIKLNHIPTMDDMPIEVSQMAWEAVKGSWVETYAMGLIENCHDYDLNLAYAAELAKIPDFRKGTWIHSKEIPDKATHGIATGMQSTQAHFHPYIVKVGNENSTSVGTYPNTISLQKIRCMQKYKNAEFKISDGHFWIPSEYGNQFQPYKGTVNYLWNMRQGQTGIDKGLCTRLYASLYGLSLQTLPNKKGFGDYYCPIVGMTVEDNTHINIFETCYNNGITPLAIMTDGFLSPKELPIHSTELGKWKLSYKGKVIINSANAIAFEGKDEGASELALKYNWLINEIRKNPEATSYSKSKYSPVTLSKALAYLGQDFNKLGMIEKVELKFNVGQDRKRAFFRKPITGADLISGQIYDSMPLPYDVVSMPTQILERADEVRPRT